MRTRDVPFTYHPPTAGWVTSRGTMDRWAGSGVASGSGSGSVMSVRPDREPRSFERMR